MFHPHYCQQQNHSAQSCKAPQDTDMERNCSAMGQQDRLEREMQSELAYRQKIGVIC